MLLYISITEYSQAMGTRETEQTAQLWTNEHYQTTASLLSANENSTVLFPVSLFCSMFTPLRLLLFFFLPFTLSNMEKFVLTKVV